MSSKVREQEVFACMVHNLFEEWRFFPRYPEKVNISARATPATHSAGIACQHHHYF
jgi:hypothetical protein